MESIWSKTCKIRERRVLDREIRTEVVIIGAGMSGILTAYQLKKAGIQTVILEAKRIGGGQTKNTTAKITSQHGLFCDRFIQKKGEKAAGLYIQANQKAIEEYERIVREENIPCDFEKTNSYVYSSDIRKLKNEVSAAEKLGVSASYIEYIEVPVACAGAVKFEKQAQFHPLKFISALSEELEIYENSCVIEVEDNIVRTEKGAVTADQIVFATHYPFVNFPGLYFTRMHQERSYVLALENAGNIEGVYIGDGEESYSFRNYQQYTLLGGKGHRTGENKAGNCYESLRRTAREWFPESREIAAWSAQDCITPDQIPFVGIYAKSKPNWFVATGFNKWGMTSSMVAAMLLRDMICGTENPYAQTFSSSRFGIEEVPQILKDAAKSASGLTKSLFHVSNKKPPVCSHLGCQLAWNPDEKSWDCPCHGSRFDCEGNLLDGPAQRKISHE